MRRVATAADLALQVMRARFAGKRIGFVPTMGALHEGHLALIDLAKEHCDFVVASIFVNPLQFGRGEDFKRYPRGLEADAKALERAGCDVLFAPTVEDIYPGGKPRVTHRAGRVAELFEGKARPGHFDGMLTVVARLFELVQPDLAVFGTKDAQQLFLVRKLARDLAAERVGADGGQEIEILPAPTIRDVDGLALSSRNRFLSLAGRRQATVLFKALAAAERVARGGAGVQGALFAANTVLAEVPEAKLDYLAVVSEESFLPVPEDFRGEARMLIAVVLENVRLIDNASIRF